MAHGKLHITTTLLLAISLNGCTCVSKNDTAQNQTQKASQPLPEISLPPGSAEIQALIEDFREEENSFLCKMKVSEVDSYGPATPPLPQGYVITLDVPKSLLEKNKYDAGKILIRGKLLKMRVRHQGAVPNGGSAERWTATGFSNSTK